MTNKKTITVTNIQWDDVNVYTEQYTNLPETDTVEVPAEFAESDDVIRDKLQDKWGPLVVDFTIVTEK